MTDTCPVLVAGAGPTGLTLACDLLASGVAVRVVDRAAGPASTSRALGLQPRGVEVLDRAGALGDLEQRSNPVRQVSVDLGGRTTAHLRLGQRTKLVTRPGLIVSQAEIEGGLRRRLAQLGGTVEWGREVLDAHQDGEGVAVQLSDGRAMRCEWLVGCDGAHSRVRKVAGIGFPGVQIIERFLLADVHADLPVARDTVLVWLHGEEMLAAFPLPEADLWRLMAPAPDDAGDDLGPQVVLSLLTRRLHERTGWPASALGTAEWTSTFRIHRRLADRFRQGRILLAGDAAHIHSPVGGQGLNTGVGDAENLAWKLALVVHQRGAPTLLDSYEAERRPIAAEVLESTSAMTRMVVGESRLARVLRDRVFVPSLNHRLVQRLIWEQASQLKVSYRSGPLAARSRHPFLRPRPGDRVPDLTCRRLDGSATRLHAELGARWVLLTPPASTPPAALATQSCIDLTRQRLGADLVTVLAPTGRRHGPHLLLVRPDAHLGWRGSPAPAALEGWLTGVLDDGHVVRGRSRFMGSRHERTLTGAVGP